MTETLRYTLEDVSSILRMMESPPKLSIEIQQLLKTLENALNISEKTEYAGSTGTSYKQRNSYAFGNNGSTGYSERQHGVEKNGPTGGGRGASWKTPKPVFKTTKIEKKEGIDQKINEIRICLNKISEKNYDSQRDQILSLMNEVEEDLHKVAMSIFDIASTNKFYSAMYAQLYKELINSYPIFSSILDTFLNNFSETVHSLTFVDPNSNYDLFCEYNKKNDKRKATATFIVQLMIKDVVSVERVGQIIAFLQDLMLSYIDEPNKTNEIDEMTELLFLFIGEGHQILRNNNDSWSFVIERVRQISQFKVKEHKSISSRSVFKHLDIISLVNR